MAECIVFPAAKQSRPFYDNYEAFYEAYRGLVVGYLRKRMNSPDDAEDIASKVFLYCYERWETYDPQKAAQQTWLFMIVRSRLADYLRYRKTYVDIDKLDTYLTEDDDPMDSAVKLQAIRQELAEALKNLPENQRTAIVMRYFGEYSDFEIAARLNTTPGNVRVIIHRGLSRLKTDKAIAECAQSLE